MIRHTHTDAKTATRDTTVETHATTRLAGMARQLGPNTWIEMKAEVPTAALCSTSARRRGRVLTIDSGDSQRVDHCSVRPISQDADVFPQRCGSVSVS